MYIIYFLIAICATIVGSMTGMGGGVIIKPLFDILGTFDAQTIGVLSSITVLSMSLVSATRNIIHKTPIDYKVAAIIAIGSIIGGSVGQSMLEIATSSLANNVVVIVQNVQLGLMLIAIIIYMRNKNKIKTYEIKNNFVVFLVGLSLGIISSFLGIGGGPINVVVFIFLFSYPTKKAAISSLITILFAQISKLASVMIGGGFAAYDLSALPLMVIGAIAGGFIGAKIAENLGEEAIDVYFNMVQVFVLVICVINIVRNLG